MVLDRLVRSVEGIEVLLAMWLERSLPAALVALTTELSEVSAAERVQISVTAPDEEQLLVEWLDAVIYEMATRHMVFCRFEVRIEGGRLEGTLWGRASRRPAAYRRCRGERSDLHRASSRRGGAWPLDGRVYRRRVDTARMTF